MLVVPRSLVAIGWENLDQIPQCAYIESYSVIGSTFSYQYKRYEPPSLYPAYSGNIGVADVFSVSGAEPQSGYGIRIRNGSNFMSISDKSYLGFVTWRGVVSINGTWSIPQSVLSLGNYVVFCRWNNATIPLFLNRDAARIECYSGFASADGSGIAGSVSDVQVVIVSCGFSPALPDSRYGLVIRNSLGVITFTSKFAPVKWSGAYYRFDGYEIEGSTNGNGSGEVNRWRDPFGSVSRPMIPLCSIGFQRGDFLRRGSSINYTKVLYSGMKMSGNSVTSSRAMTSGKDAALGYFPDAFESSCTLPCLDAADYF